MTTEQIDQHALHSPPAWSPSRHTYFDWPWAMLAQLPDISTIGYTECLVPLLLCSERRVPRKSYGRRQGAIDGRPGGLQGGRLRGGPACGPEQLPGAAQARRGVGNLDAMQLHTVVISLLCSQWASVVSVGCGPVIWNNSNCTLHPSRTIISFAAVSYLPCLGLESSAINATANSKPSI